MQKHLLFSCFFSLLVQPVAAIAQPLDGNGSMAFSRAIPAVAEPAGSLTLQAAIALAEQANAQVSAAARELDAAGAAVMQAGALPNPELATLFEDRDRDTRTTTVQINQPISFSGQRLARIRAAEHARDIAGVDLGMAQTDIRASVIAAFYEVVIGQERLQLAQAAAGLAQRGTEIAAKRVAAGKVSPVDATRARIAEAGARAELNQAQSALRLARQRLSSHWGNALPRFDAAIGAADNFPLARTAGDTTRQLDQAPGIRRARMEVERRRALTDVERRRRIPDVTVSLGAKRDEQLGRNQVILGFSMPIPAFDRNQGNIGEALAREDKARDELALLRVQVEGQAMAAWEAFNVASAEAATLAKDVLPDAQGALDAAMKGFEYGKFNFLDVLDAQRTLFQVRTQYLRALADAHRAQATLDRLLGTASLAATDASNTHE